MPEFHRPITPGTPQGRSVGLEGSIHARPTGDESPSVSIVGSARRSQTSMSRQRSSRKDPHRRDDCTRTPTKAGCISIIGSAELRSPTGRGPATPANSVALEQSIYALPPGANQTPLSERPEFRLRSPTAAKSQRSTPRSDRRLRKPPSEAGNPKPGPPKLGSFNEDQSAREQNRLRKLQAQGTREWDTPKDRSETAAPPTGTATSEKSVSRQASAAEPPSPRSPAPRRVSAERKPSTSHPPTPAVPVTPVQVEANPTLAAVNLKSAPESTKSLASTPVAESDLASSSAAVGGVNADQPTVFPQKPAVDLALTRLPKLTESVHARPPAISGPSPAKSPTTIRRPPTDRKAPAYRPPSVRAQAKAKATTSAKPVPDVTVALPSSTPPKSVVEDLAAMIKSDAHINWDEDDDF